MNKKTYSKPELKTRKIELGVFGDYGKNGENVKPSSVTLVGELGLRME